MCRGSSDTAFRSLPRVFDRSHSKNDLGRIERRDFGCIGLFPTRKRMEINHPATYSFVIISILVQGINIEPVAKRLTRERNRDT